MNKAIDISILGTKLIKQKRFGDERGFFEETWNKHVMDNTHGIAVDFVQDNHSYSATKGTLRGLHFQSPPHAQDKLVRCTRGVIYDVAVDIRVGSPTFGRYQGVELSAENGLQFFIPKGFLHGFLTLQDNCEVQYKCSDYYSPACDGSVLWDSLGIEWPFDGAPILSKKDADAVPFAQFKSPFIYGENA